jgi:acyl CoA:acetate/3-ketoacid CoA transferase alpha subunit
MEDGAACGMRLSRFHHRSVSQGLLQNCIDLCGARIIALMRHTRVGAVAVCGELQVLTQGANTKIAPIDQEPLMRVRALQGLADVGLIGALSGRRRGVTRRPYNAPSPANGACGDGGP